MKIRYDLSTTFQPYPLSEFRNDRDFEDLDELGSLLVRRSLSPHAAVSAGVAGEFHLPMDTNLFTAAPGIDAAHQAISRWQQRNGFLRVVPDDESLSTYDPVTEDVGMINGFRLPMDHLLKQDKSKTLILSSPNGISGRISTLQEVVRLVRHFRLVVIDERMAAFSLRRLTPLVLEWDNIMFVQRFPFRMPGQSGDFAWMVHPGSLRDQIREHVYPLSHDLVDEALEIGGINTWRAERHITRQKSQLYRELRKLSIVSVPYPSWANFLLARVERGDRDDIVARLAERGIAVYAPPHPNLQQHIRVTAVSTDATMALKQALIEINREI